MQRLTVNPFKRDYHESELSSMNLEPKTFRNIELKVKNVSGRLNGYMYRDFVIDYNNVPVLFIDGKLWMSITPMEIESHYMPILFANNRVGVAGLGLGYYVQRILDKEEVEEVVVYEINQDVIDFYLENFGNHEKLTIVNQDVRTINDEYFDFFYCDIYPTQLDSDAIRDMAILTKNNVIAHYHFWCFEHALLEMINDGYGDDIPKGWLRDYYPFIEIFLEEKSNLANLQGFGDQLFEEFSEYGLL